ncbi:MAG: PAS domain S-box protein [Acidobacteriia bacterium]|nr:PAS domain S-box protein [Terriglobia bacterium]
MARDSTGLSIFPRLLIAFVGVVIIMSSILTAVFYVFSRKSVEKRTEEYVRQQFQTISYNFGSELRNALVKDLQLLASNPLLDEFLMSSEAEREVTARAVERSFLESLKASRSYQSITFVDAAGREAVKVDWSGRVRKLRFVGDQPLFARLRAAGSPGSIDMEGPFTDQYGNILFSTGIYKTDQDIGKFGGAVIIDYNLEEFFNYAGRIKIFGKNPIWLFAPGGTVLKRQADDQSGFDPRGYFAKGFQRDPLLTMVDDGMLVYQDLSIIPDRPLLRLAISIPSSLLLRDMRSVLQFFFLVFAASIVLISVIAYYLARYLSGPIIELAAAASRIARGERSAQVRVKATGEVQMLVDSFNRMAEDLEKTTVSRDYVDNIINNMVDTLIVASPDGRIIRLNAAVCVLLGYDEEELVGRPLDLVIDHVPGTGENLVDELVKETIYSGERFYRVKGGGRVPVLFSSSVMYDAQRKAAGIVCVAQDITERKRAEAQLKGYSEELAEINEELKTFAYIVSHDLRAPLVNIKGFSDELLYSIEEIKPVLEKHLADIEEGQRQKYNLILEKDIPEALKFIGSSVRRMDNLINAILKLSRAGLRKLNPEPLQTEEFVQTILHTLAHQIDTRRITVTLGRLPDLVADRTAIEQIFGNLLDNAVKYLDPARPGRITISADCGSDEIVFRIQDNGRGMSKEDIPKAFEIFRRVGKQDAPGEGMGLAYVKTLLRLLGGRIWCESEPGVGTTFSFSLPLSAGQPSERLPQGGKQ